MEINRTLRVVTDTNQKEKYVNFDETLHKIRMISGVFIIAKMTITFTEK